MINNELAQALSDDLLIENHLNLDFNLFESDRVISNSGSYSIPTLDNFLESTATETHFSIQNEDLIISDSIVSESDLLTGRKNFIEPFVNKESVENFETVEKQSENLQELDRSGVFLNELDDPKKNSEDSGDEEDVDESENVNSIGILVTTIEQQAIDNFLATTRPIGNRNYEKRGSFSDAKSDLRTFFANPLGLPINGGTAPGGIVYEFVRLSDGSTITARSSSKSTGGPTMDITYKTTKIQLKVRYRV